MKRFSARKSEAVVAFYHPGRPADSRVMTRKYRRSAVYVIVACELASTGWIAFAAIEPHFLEKFKTLNQLSDSDEETLSSLFMKKSSREWEEWAKANDLPLAEVKNKS